MMSFDCTWHMKESYVIFTMFIVFSSFSMETTVDVLCKESSSSQETELISAIKRGDDEHVAKLLEENAPVNGKEKGRSPLLVAAYYGRPKCIEMLLGKKADYNKAFLRYLTPHIVALAQHHDACVELLTAAGSTVDGEQLMVSNSRIPLTYLPIVFGDIKRLKEVVSSLGLSSIIHDSRFYRITPLFLAIAAEETECMKFLVESGTSIEESSPVMYGDMRATPSFKFLVEHSIVIKPRTITGGYEKWNAIEFAAYRGSKEGLTYLMSSLLSSKKARTIRNEDIDNERNSALLAKEKRCAIRCAALGGQRDIMELLHEEDCSLITNTDLIVYAAIGASIDCINFCLEHGLSINTRLSCQRGGTPLSHAVEWDWEHQEWEHAVRHLLDKKADIQIRGRWGDQNTVLHRAARHSSGTILKMLLDASGDINVRNGIRETPVLTAAGYGSFSVLKILVKAGADISAVDHEGNSVLHKAMVGRSRDRASMVLYLLEMKVPIEQRNKDGMRPLHLAVQEVENDNVVKLLIESGAECNAKTTFFFGKTALQLSRTEYRDILVNYYQEDSIKMLSING